MTPRTRNYQPYVTEIITNVIKAHMNSETEVACTVPALACTRPSRHIYYGFQFSVFMGFLSVQADSNTSSWAVYSFICVSCPTPMGKFSFYVNYIYYYPLKACLFCNETESESIYIGEFSGRD